MMSDKIEDINRELLENENRWKELASKQQEILRNRHNELYSAHYNDPLDEDGYPTEGALELISNWHYDDADGWFEFIESIWHLASWGWSKGESEYHISTAGWSGNEEIISAMQRNSILWGYTWYSSRRGGHYIFKVDSE